jgi:putative membrane protein insertion efficiency factor
MVAGVLVAHKVWGSRIQALLSEKVNPSATDEDDADDEDGVDSPKDKETKTSQPMSTAMIASIGVYKNFISPLLPPACRFLPTCSQYGVQAITEFGPSKGGILTAWRLLRCSPVGGKGYDPPKWPPVKYTYSSY